VTFEEGRALFPVLDRYAYLQAGSVGPLARGTIEAVLGEEEAGLEQGRGSYLRFMGLLEARDELRKDVAALVGVSAQQVALTASTTDEHFGLLGPLHTSGATVVVTDPDPERIVAAVTPRTRLIALSHVLWTTGAVLPVHDLRASTGVPILVDGAQSVGAMPVVATGIDFYTISGQKWLCGPEGTGALVVADPDALRIGRPSYLSQDGYEQDGAFEPREGAARFDPNLTPGSAVAGLRAAIAAIPPWAFERAAEVAERFRARLADVGEDVVVPESRATLVSWRAPADESATIVERLADAGVIVRDLPGRGLIRASVGWWTNDDDLERLVASL